jgi:hypothetical protein
MKANSSDRVIDALLKSQHLLLYEIMRACGRVLIGATGSGAYGTMFSVKGERHAEP